MSDFVALCLMLVVLVPTIAVLVFYDNHRVLPTDWPQELQSMLVHGVTVSQFWVTSDTGWTIGATRTEYVQVQTQYGTFFIPHIQDCAAGVEIGLVLKRSHAPWPLRLLDRREFISPPLTQSNNGQ